MNRLEKLGWTIRKYRRSQNITQEKLAEMAKRDRTYISNIENGKTNVSVQAYFEITDALNIEPWKLMREALEN